MNKRNLIPRLLSLPFMVFILLIPMVVLYFKWMKKWILFGGEIVAYDDKNEIQSIRELYLLMKSKNEI